MIHVSFKVALALYVRSFEVRQDMIPSMDTSLHYITICLQFYVFISYIIISDYYVIWNLLKLISYTIHSLSITLYNVYRIHYTLYIRYTNRLYQIPYTLV